MYQIEYVRDGKVETYVGTLAQVRTLAEYLNKTFRITATYDIAPTTNKEDSR